MTAETDEILIEVARERKLSMDRDCLPKAIGCVDYGDEEVRPPPPDVQFRMTDFKDPVRTGEELVERLNEIYDGYEIVVYEGGQEVYDYLLAVE